MHFIFSIETIRKQDKTQKYKQLSSKIQQSPKLRQRGVKESQNRRNPNPPYKESTKYCNHQAKIEETQTQYKGSIKYCSNSSVNYANLDTTMKEKRREQMEMVVNKGATKYSKYRKGRCSRGCKPDGTQLGFGRYGIKSCRAGRLSYRAIEAARRAIIGHFHRAMSGQFRRNGKIWVRVFADIPITGKPTEVRMGRGKGNPTGWIARVSRGQILFEMDGVSLSNARQAATLAAHKLCLSTKFVQWS